MSGALVEESTARTAASIALCWITEKQRASSVQSSTLYFRSMYQVKIGL